MPIEKRPSKAKVVGLLNRYDCAWPFDELRAYFMGCIASPRLDRSPMHCIEEVWGGELPTFDITEARNYFFDVLISGLWNPLTMHQVAGQPFKLTRMQFKDAPENLHEYALVRSAEICAFRGGLFGEHQELDFPDNVRRGLTAIEDMEAMLENIIALIEDFDVPPTPRDLEPVRRCLRLLTPNLEEEINTIIVSCVRSRRNALADIPKPTIH